MSMKTYRFTLKDCMICDISANSAEQARKTLTETSEKDIVKMICLEEVPEVKKLGITYLVERNQPEGLVEKERFYYAIYVEKEIAVQALNGSPSVLLQDTIKHLAAIQGYRLIKICSVDEIEDEGEEEA